MNTFLTIQSTYHDVQIALVRKNSIVSQDIIDKRKASKLLIIHLQRLLTQESMNVRDLSFIAVNQGPAPFTTLRVVLASVNGLSFAQHIPLIGVDALDTILAEWNNPSYPTTIVLFNAFSDDVYVAIEHPGQATYKGYKNIDTVLQHCYALPGIIRFIGNGAELYYNKIKTLFGNRAYIPEPLPLYCSLAQIANIGYQQWQQNPKGSNLLLPLYLKKYHV